MIKHHDMPTDELVRRLMAGEKPAFTWRKCLYLEWYSNANGRVVIQSTRLEVERIGERAFELTEDLWKEQALQNADEFGHLICGRRRVGRIWRDCPWVVLWWGLARAGCVFLGFSEPT